MRGNGVVDPASGMLPSGHLGWAFADRAEFRARARQYLADGIAAGHRVEFAGDGTAESLRRELLDLDPHASPVLREAYEREQLAIRALEDLYAFQGRSEVIDPAVSVARRASAMEDALTAGYTGLRSAIDASVIAMTAAQRRACAQFEHLVDKPMSTRPLAALCAYNQTTLGLAACELTCLHPYVASGSGKFRLFSTDEAELALAGEVDRSGWHALAAALEYIGERSAGDTLRVWAADLIFLDHRGLSILDEHAAALDQTVVLRCAGPAVRRLVSALEPRHLVLEA